MNFSDEFIVRTFNDIDEGKYTNATFSGTEVVMISRKLYDTLIEAWQAKCDEEILT